MSAIEQEYNYFCDSFTGILLKNPVMANDGYIYEKEFIEKYLEFLFSYSPITGKQINKDFIVPIEFIEKLKQFYVDHPEMEKKQYVNFNSMIETLLKSEINEENLDKMIKIFKVKQEIPFQIENLEWFKALINTELGVFNYGCGNYCLKDTIMNDQYIDVHNLVMYCNIYKYYISIFDNLEHFIFVACRQNKLHILEYIYKYNKKLFKSNFSYYIPLFYISCNKNKDCVKILEYIHSKNDKLYLQMYNGNSIFKNIIIDDYLEVFKYMLTIDPSLHKTEKINKKSVISYLCLNGRIDMLKHLYSIDNNIYKDEPDKIELMTELNSSEYCGIILPFILEIL